MPAVTKAGLARALAFLVLWLALAGRGAGDLPVGIVVAAAAAWASLRLAPPSGASLNPRAALAFSGDFLRLSLLSGLDVARRAFSPTPDLRPGVIETRLDLPPGFARNAFSMIASLLPGTLLTGFDPGDEQKAYVHGLDVRQPIAAELADEEAAFMRMIGHE
jgi:multicomponent Na+:H+ antiporter subunit E